MSTMADTKAKRTRRKFAGEYKEGAARLILDQGNTVAAVARDLGLTKSALRNGIEQSRADRTQGRTGLTTAEREELVRLRKELRIVQEEREILKGDCAQAPASGRRVAASFRPRLHVRERGLSGHPRGARHHLQHESPRQLLGQRGHGEFFSTVKSELAERFDSHGETKTALFDFIEVFYNQRRRHSTLG
jgi:transposase